MSKVIDCEECDGRIQWNTSDVLYSHPPKYKGECMLCGNIAYIQCTEIDNLKEAKDD